MLRLNKENIEKEVQGLNKGTKGRGHEVKDGYIKDCWKGRVWIGGGLGEKIGRKKAINSCRKTPKWNKGALLEREKKSV